MEYECCVSGKIQAEIIKKSSSINANFAKFIRWKLSIKKEDNQVDLKNYHHYAKLKKYSGEYYQANQLNLSDEVIKNISFNWR